MKKKQSNDGFYPPFHQIMRKMKLTILLLCITVLNSLSMESYSQETRLTVVVNNTTIENVLRKIENQSKFRFFYNEKIDINKEVSVNYINKDIFEILDNLLKETNITYEIVGRQIVLSRKSSSQQQKSVEGRVTDRAGAPLPGVTVSIKGSTRGTVSDSEGNYNLVQVPDDAILVFSFVGMKPLEIPVGKKQQVNVSLEENTIGIDEVVAVGYGVQKKVNLTGAIDVIDNNELESRQSPTVSQLLQGQSPGLTFSTDNDGFQPGATMNIQIRGTGSLNGGSPYVVIDGIPGDMDRLNPEDIESISVLKDAAASAIYGARAPYGVILITTKSGNKDEKLSITYSGSVSLATPQNLPSMLNSEIYAKVLNEAGDNLGGRPYTDDVIDRIRAYNNGNIDYLKQFTTDDAIYFETTPQSDGTWGANNESNANYDWFDEYYGSAINHSHDLTIRGGTSTASYYLSAGYLGQEGVLNYGEDTFGRTNVMGKVNFSITSWWDISYQSRFMKSKRIRPNMDNQGSYDLIFHQIARTPPTQAKYDGNGYITIQSKIPWVNDAGTDNTEITENWHTFATELRPVKGWKINADYAYKSVDGFRSDQELTVYDHLVDGSEVESGNTVPSSIQQYHTSNYYWTTNVYSSYDFSISNRHNFSVLAGTQFEYNKERELNVLKNNLITSEVPSLQTATGDAVATETLEHWATEGYFGRFKYNFMDKYLVEINVRRDGTSRFTRGNRWGTFPSVALAWNLHQEKFWSSIEKYVNSFKIRSSWGQLGNQNVESYQDLELITYNTSALNWIFGYGETKPVGYAEIPELVSSGLTWETAVTKNAGANMSFLGNRLQADFDLFERRTKNMIGTASSLPGVIGADLPLENNATLRTRGWELTLRWKQTINQDLSYFVNFNLYDSKSVIMKYLNTTGTLSDYYVGYEEGEIWGYTAKELFRTQEELDQYTAKTDLSSIYGGTWNTGDLKYLDTNNDGAVNNGSNTIKDHGDLSVIGNSDPHYQFGLSLGINYKNFDFSMIWKGVAKRDLFFSASQNIFWGFRTWNQTSLFPGHLDYFRDQEGTDYAGLYQNEKNINTDAYWPRPYLSNAANNKNRETSTRYLQNGAYARLQNVQLGYNLSSKVLSRLRLQKARFYLSGENLLTISKLTAGIDPVAISSSWGVGKTYGANRIFSMGVTVTY